MVRLQERYGQPARTTLRLPAGVIAAREVNAAEEEVGPFALPGAAGGRGRRPAQPRPTAGHRRAEAVSAAHSCLASGARGVARTRRCSRRGGGPHSAGAPSPRQSDCCGGTYLCADRLPFNLDGVTSDRTAPMATSTDAKAPSRRNSCRRSSPSTACRLRFGSGATGAKNVLVPKGEHIALPAGSFNRVYMLAAAIDGDVPATIG